MNELVPTVITDKNGRVTTVHRKVGGGRGSATAIPAPAAKSLTPAEQLDDYRRRIEVILDGLTTDYRKAVMPCYMNMSSYMLKPTVSMLEFNPNGYLVDMIEVRSNISRAHFERWLNGMNAVITRSDVPIDGLLGDAVAGVIDLQQICNTYSDLDDDQMAVMVELCIAASEPDLDFGLTRHSRSAYGRIIEHSHTNFLEMVIHQPEELTKRALNEISSKRIKRMAELESFLEGDQPTAIISGIL